MCLVWKGERESPVKLFVARSERVSQKSLVFALGELEEQKRGEKVLKISPGKERDLEDEEISDTRVTMIKIIHRCYYFSAINSAFNSANRSCCSRD